MMTKRDYENLGSALSRSLPNMMVKVTVYERLIPLLARHDPKFDSQKFGASMRLPKTFRKDKYPNKEEVAKCQ